MARWGIALVALAGCDVVFNADHVYECPLDDDDCDELRDRVDPCPADPGDDADEDRDGVGDECDPNVGVPNDSLLEFESFTESGNAWTARGEATWEMDRSALVLGVGAVERMVPANIQPTVEVVFDATFPTDVGSVGVFVASKSSTGIPLECRVEHHADGDDLVMLVGDPAAGQPFEAGRARQLPGKPGDRLRIYGSQLANFDIRCRARYGRNDTVSVDWVFFTAPADLDTVGFRVDNASAKYGSLAIYTTQ
ncbi:MAG TPA: hypothetical protein VIV11_00750 [Kofleriaceae bacterium]